MTFSFDTNQQLSKVCEQKDMASRIAQSFIMQDWLSTQGWKIIIIIAFETSGQNQLKSNSINESRIKLILDVPFFFAYSIGISDIWAAFNSVST